MTQEKLASYLGLEYEKKVEIWLDIILLTIKQIKTNHNITLNLKSIDLNDKATYGLIQSKNTDDIYKLKGEYMHEFKNKFKPTNFSQLKDMHTLYRPSPLAYGIVDEYLENKYNKKNINYISKEFKKALKPILKSTYGVILYHEQILDILQTIGNFSFSKADIVRYAMTKNYKEQIEIFKVEFIETCVKNGAKKENCMELFDIFSKYTPPSYSQKIVTAHAKLTFYLAYLKTHFKDEYIKAYKENNK